MLNHLMTDLETLGTSSNAVFLSIAAVQFDLDGTIGDHFKANVDITSALEFGLTIDGSTLQWWLTQRPEIMKLMFADPVHISHVLNRLSLFIKSKGTSYIWGNSARFDLGILANAYDKLNIDLPWSFRNERCYRTMLGMFGAPERTQLEKIADENYGHDPIFDCRKQIQILTALWKKYSPDRVMELENVMDRHNL